MVWKATSRIGCGFAQCGSRPFTVCNYDSPGNVDTQFDENVQL